MDTDKNTVDNKSMTKKGKGKEKQLEEQLKRLEDELKRALADYRNLERHVGEERRILGQLSSALLIEKLLPILDNLENAQKHLSDQGLEMVIKQFNDLLLQEGLTQIEAEGSLFDPNVHEATEVVEGEKDNTIVKVVRKGYKINDRVLRPAQVVVERTSLKDDQSKEEKTVEQNNF